MTSARKASPTSLYNLISSEVVAHVTLITMSPTFVAKQHIDSVDVNYSSGLRIAIGLSSLDGNTWDGGISLLSSDGSELCSKQSPAGISMVRFSGSRLLLAARDDGVVVMYSSDKLEEMQVFEAHDDVVSCVASDSHQESQFLSGGWDGSIYIWDWRTHASKHAPLMSYKNCHNGHVTDVKYSPFEKNIFSSVGGDGFYRQWDSREAPSSGCASIVNIGQTCSCLSYDQSDKNIVLVGTAAGEIIEMDIRSSNPIISRLKKHNGRVRRILSVEGSPGKFFTASDDKTFSICNRYGNTDTFSRYDPISKVHQIFIDIFLKLFLTLFTFKKFVSSIKSFQNFSFIFLIFLFAHDHSLSYLQTT